MGGPQSVSELPLSIELSSSSNFAVGVLNNDFVVTLFFTVPLRLDTKFLEPDLIEGIFRNELED